MGLQNLSSETRGFLYNLFHEAAKPFEVGAFDQQDTVAAGKLKQAFRSAAFAARMHDAASVETRITELKDLLSKATSPDMQEALDEIRLRQKLMYKYAGQGVKNDLGTYSGGIF